MSRAIFRSLHLMTKRNDYRPKIVLLLKANCFHSQKRLNAKTDDFDQNKLMISQGFLSIKEKNKKNFLAMIDVYLERDKLLVGHVEFIYAALKYMKEFGVDKDLEIYKKLIDIFPKGKMVPRNIFQAEFMHYPKHQQCAIDLLEQMEEKGVLPDWEMQEQLINVFGHRGHPVRRYWRMMYWMPKFKHASPWPLPEDVPNDTLELAKLAIARMSSIDPTIKISVFNTKEVPDSLEDTWIVSGQSPTQCELMSLMPKNSTLYVEGGFKIWLRNRAVTYFTLWTEHFRKFEDNNDTDDVSNLLQKVYECKPTVYENDEVVTLGVASSGTSSPDSMLSWIRMLTTTSPAISRHRILFRTSSTPKDVHEALATPLDKIDSK